MPLTEAVRFINGFIKEGSHLETYATQDALECTADQIFYANQDLSKYYKKGHLYEILKVNDGVVYIVDHECLDYAFFQEDVSKFFKKTSYQFPSEPTQH